MLDIRTFIHCVIARNEAKLNDEAIQNIKSFFHGLPRRNNISPRNDMNSNDTNGEKLYSQFTIYNSHAFAFTLAEILITLGVIGIVAALTVPNLIQNSQESQWVAGLQKFNTNLQQAVQLWKQDIGCTDSAYNCLVSQNLSDGDCTNFDQIGKFMKISQSYYGGSSKNWLPYKTLNYSGADQTGVYGGVSNFSIGLCRYQLQDGTTFGLDVDADGFAIWIDTNGEKSPNRVGKDTFPLTLGFGYRNQDINYYALDSNAVRNAEGLCRLIAASCNPNNTDPTKDNGASPTAYVILNHKIPDFKALASTVANFKP